MNDGNHIQPNEKASQGLPREFLTEADIQREREQRQLEWEKVRRATDPMEAPPEVFDTRPLWERLREQQERKRISFEEQYSHRNTIKGLDEDEFHFLSDVDRMKAQNELRIKREEEELLSEFRRRQTPVAVPGEAPKGQPVTFSMDFGEMRRPDNQLSLLMGAVKRKLSGSNDCSLGEPVRKKTLQEEPVEAPLLVESRKQLPSVTSSSESDRSDAEDAECTFKLARYLLAAKRSLIHGRRKRHARKH